MSLGTCHNINCVVADGSPESRLNVKFVQDTSKFWYKPDISREQGKMLRIYLPLLAVIETLLLCLLLYFVGYFSILESNVSSGTRCACVATLAFILNKNVTA